jgi:hypothetical protein
MSAALTQTSGEVGNPYEQVVFRFGVVHGLEETFDITESFQERVEPPIKDLERALGCEPREGSIWLSDLLTAWPAGKCAGLDFRPELQ